MVSLVVALAISLGALFAVFLFCFFFYFRRNLRLKKISERNNKSNDDFNNKTRKFAIKSSQPPGIMRCFSSPVDEPEERSSKPLLGTLLTPEKPDKQAEKVTQNKFTIPRSYHLVEPQKKKVPIEGRDVRAPSVDMLTYEEYQSSKKHIDEDKKTTIDTITDASPYSTNSINIDSHAPSDSRSSQPRRAFSMGDLLDGHKKLGSTEEPQPKMSAAAWKMDNGLPMLSGWKRAQSISKALDGMSALPTPANIEKRKERKKSSTPGELKFEARKRRVSTVMFDDLSKLNKGKLFTEKDKRKFPAFKKSDGEKDVKLLDFEEEDDSIEDNVFDRTSDSTSTFDEEVKEELCTKVYSTTTHKISDQPNEMHSKIFGEHFGKKRGKTYKVSGKMSFCMHLSDRGDRVLITKIFVNNLTNLSIGFHSNTFIVAYLLPGKEQRQSTNFCHGHSTPTFEDEQFEFNHLDASKISSQRMKFKLWNKNKFRKDELLGEVDVYLKDSQKGITQFKTDLYNKRSINADVRLKLSICNEPAAGTLKVNIQEITGLSSGKKGGLSGLPTTSVAATLFKHNKKETKTTRPQKKTATPEFNEVLTFNLQVDYYFPLTTYSLAVTVNKTNLYGSLEPIGHVIFSLDSPQPQAKEDWVRVQDNPHQLQEITCSLLDPDEL